MTSGDELLCPQAFRARTRANPMELTDTSDTVSVVWVSADDDPAEVGRTGHRAITGFGIPLSFRPHHSTRGLALL